MSRGSRISQWFFDKSNAIGSPAFLATTFCQLQWHRHIVSGMFVTAWYSYWSGQRTDLRLPDRQFRAQDSALRQLLRRRLCRLSFPTTAYCATSTSSSCIQPGAALHVAPASGRHQLHNLLFGLFSHRLVNKIYLDLQHAGYYKQMFVPGEYFAVKKLKYVAKY